MSKVEYVLLCQRSDGKFLKLTHDVATTEWEFVDEPEFATPTVPHNFQDFETPRPAADYFENSFRAREYWTKDCVMVPYRIVTTATRRISC